MKRFATTALALAVMVLPVTDAKADPLADICHARAQKESGYHGPRKGLSKRVGNTQMRLSGSVGLGVSRSSGPQSGTQVPGFAGQDAIERREQKAHSKYTRIYDDCMQSR